MALKDERWVSVPQYQGIQAGLRVINAWAEAGDNPESALDWALRREDSPADVVVGLATVARLLAVELAAATGRTETSVLDQLAVTIHRLQHQASAADDLAP
jgi:hypothetical protein